MSWFLEKRFSFEEIEELSRVTKQKLGEKFSTNLHETTTMERFLKSARR
jgi:hypothetical protein